LNTNNKEKKMNKELNYGELDADSNFKFDEEKHIYTVDGIEIPSVTQIVAPKVNEDFVALAAEYGTTLHNAMADYIKAGLMPSARADKVFLKDFRSAKDFVDKEVKHCEAICEERGCYINDGMKFAGCADLITDNVRTKNRIIYDLKTSEPHKWHKAQLGGYALLFGTSSILVNIYIKDGVWRTVSHDTGEAIAEFRLAYNRFIAGDEIASGAELLPIEETLLANTQEAFDYFCDLQKQAEVAEAKLKDFKLILIAQMQKHDIKSFNYKSIKFTLVDAAKRQTLDAKALKADLPDIAEAYTKESEVGASLRITNKEA
jgi:hypothetical protein